jgi:phosphoesterase RecJ-like protein
MDLFSQSIEEVSQLFQVKRKIALFIHCNPDGDALGSALALKEYFENAGHEISVITPNDFPEYYAWLPGADKIRVYENHAEEVNPIIEKADIFFGVDFNDWDRIKSIYKVLKNFKKPTIVIDHHPNPNIDADYVYSCTKVSSAAEIVYEFMLRLNLMPINKTIATCIFTGVMTDTGNFSYNDANPRTYSIISELSSFDIDKERIRRLLFQVFSYNRMRLKGYALNEKMRFFPEFHAAYIWLTMDDLARFEHKLGDTEGFVNLPLDIKEVHFSVLFVEKDNKIKMSLRSKGNFNVNEFARKHFDGGGHVNAAGGRSFLSMEATLKKFETLLENYKTELENSYSYA